MVIGASFSGLPPFDFGRTSTGTSVSRQLQVGAISDFVDETEITGVTVTGDAFRLADETCTGATFPGPPCKVTIIATPPEAGEYRGDLSLAGARTGRGLLVVGESEEGGPNGNPAPLPDTDTEPGESSATTSTSPSTGSQ
ncbi:hypothetical protein ACI797_06775 [Geodermatophilus sp. SYSU D00691]